MSRSQKVIDYLDLKISFLASQTEDLTQAVEDYEASYDYIKMTPKLRKSQLLINSNDLIPFLGYLQIGDWTQLDRRRLKTEIRSRLEDILQKALHAESRVHYQWCLAALENFEWGRFLQPEDQSNDNTPETL